jgi:hypothetical protein
MTPPLSIGYVNGAIPARHTRKLELYREKSAGFAATNEFKQA